MCCIPKCTCQRLLFSFLKCRKRTIRIHYFTDYSVNSCTCVKSVKVEQTDNKVGLTHCSMMLIIAAYGMGLVVQVCPNTEGMH